MALSNNLFIAVSPWFGGKLGLFGFLSDLWSHNLKYSSDSPGMQDDRQPLVSIITIVYNGEKHIADCVRSVQRQKYPNLQYIVVDGGSMDNTLAILKQFPDVITDLISEKDEGISDAFNKGILRARGRIIGLINADDWYEDGAVEMAVKAMTDADIAYGDLQLWKDGSPDFILTGDHSRIRQQMRINHPTVFVKRECYERFGLFDKQYRCAMDYDLLLRFYVSGCRFKHIPAIMANYRWEGLSDHRWMLGVRETLAIKNKYLPQRRLANHLYYYRHILVVAIPKLLGKWKLTFLPRLYRSLRSRWTSRPMSL
jgi:glycosyltransferase involved in cell wall biosynthesis